MMQVIEQSDEEKLKMYLSMPPEEVAKMLIESNKHLKRIMESRMPHITEIQHQIILSKKQLIKMFFGRKLNLIASLHNGPSGVMSKIKFTVK